MARLAAELETKKNRPKKNALVRSTILGLIAAGIAYLALDGQGPAMRLGSAAATGAVVFGLFGLFFSWRKRAGSAAGSCGKCAANASIKRTGHTEIVALTEPKETRDPQPDHTIKLVKWEEDTIAVTDTYTCAKCGNVTTKHFTKTVRRDETQTIEPAPKKPAPEKPDKKASDLAKQQPAKRVLKLSERQKTPRPAGGPDALQTGNTGGKASDIT